METIRKEYPIRDDASGSPRPVRETVETVSGIFRVSAAVLSAVTEDASGEPPSPERKRISKKHGDFGVLVFDLLISEDLKPSTAYQYSRMAGRFAQWGAEHHVEGEFTAAHVAAFLDALVDKSRKRARKQYGDQTDPRGRGLRRLAFYALKRILHGCFGLDLMSGFGSPARPDPIRPVSRETVKALVNAASRDSDLLNIFVANGLDIPPGKAAVLRWEDFDADSGCLNEGVVGWKNPMRFREELRRTLRVLRRRLERGPFLFPPYDSDAGSGPVCVRTLQHRLSRLAASAGVAEHVTLTALRKAVTLLPTLGLTASDVPGAVPAVG